MLYSTLAIFSGLLTLASTAVCRPRADMCSVAALSSGLGSNATVLSATFVAAGGSFGEGTANPAFPINPTHLPATCAVLVNVTTTSTSSFRFGLFLPTTTWNERYLTVGNGGFSGGINWLDMGAGLQYGFAVASTDMGHNSSIFDLSWALNQPEKRNDFGYRATHGTTVIAKSLVRTFYGSAPKYSYYSGCSTGGRQGLKSAQVYPEDFNGMLVGAPAYWTKRLQTWTTKLGLYNLPETGPNHVGAEMFPVLAAEAIRQCDAVDGVTDGIISAPQKCKFNPATLSCNSTQTTNCLSSAQLQTIQNVYSDYTINGQLAFPGLELGSEAQWAVLLSGSTPNPLGYEYIQDFLLNDPNWPFESYDDSLVALADKLDPGSCTADNYAAMAGYQKRGGKVLMYHGQSDGLISTRSSTHFYESVASTLGIGGTKGLNSWFRFFLVPGMQHCTGTAVDAPWYFAGGNQAGAVGTDVFSVPGFTDAKHDALMALMQWTENGTPVDNIIATTWKNSTDPSSGVLKQRPLCPYPSEAVYKGSGDVNAAASWKCS
ncbi:hypothetical protein JX265_007153 [Neoarthrinium moseri]|uniref:Carboxylic ester hydrolase n=1 Tax=Neoarthrinium moseri TaxID=1658444 RepID=A0A9P9WL34_9PEZI|nr:hypothetical protein JX266_013390 [Neoarthrinium moseri]KAI1868330.1 hypothetical protein JX265_007153 [Neoarthrinium moseri]